MYSRRGEEILSGPGILAGLLARTIILYRKTTWAPQRCPLVPPKGRWTGEGRSASSRPGCGGVRLVWRCPTVSLRQNYLNPSTLPATARMTVGSSESAHRCSRRGGGESFVHPGILPGFLGRAELSSRHLPQPLKHFYSIPSSFWR